MILNQGRIKRNSAVPIRKLPRELRMMVGSYLMISPERIEALNQNELIAMFDYHLIETVLRPPHIYQ
jgi:hypothetical protein